MGLLYRHSLKLGSKTERHRKCRLYKSILGPKAQEGNPNLMGEGGGDFDE